MRCIRLLSLGLLAGRWRCVLAGPRRFGDNKQRYKIFWLSLRALIWLTVLLAAVLVRVASPPPALAVSFTATEDAYVDEDAPSTKFGTATTLRIDAAQPLIQRSFVRFSVQGVTGPITSVRLRFTCTNGGPNSTLWTASDSWTETGVTWNNQPALLSQVTSLGPVNCVSSGTVVEYDVTSLVTGDGTYNFGLTTTSGDGITYRSRETAQPPVLIFANYKVDQIHLSWEGNPAGAMNVMWRTPTSDNPATVQYGLTTSYGSSVTADSFSSTGEGHLHKATLSGLLPATTYHYRVSADDGTWSSDRTFVTSPQGPSDFRFLAAADMGTPRLGQHLNSVTVSNAMAARTAALAFTAGGGDYWYAVGLSDEATVDNWFNQNEPFMSTAPFMAAFGNHEHDTPIRYYTRFALPPPENYYSYNYAQTHFLFIDTNIAFTPGSPQRNFIESDLQAAASDPAVWWIFAVLHHPPFASSPSSQALTVRTELSPLFDAYGVDVVLTGHAHFYERTFPVLANGTVTSTNTSQYTNPGAPIYMVTGGGGADPATSCALTREAWSLICQTVYEFLEINVTRSSIQLSTIDVNGAAIDGFTLQCPDTDGDGWTDCAERIIGTNPLLKCGLNAWPPDFNDDTFITAFDLNAVANDIGKLVPPGPAREDIRPDPPDGAITAFDLNAVAGLIGKACTV